MKFFIFATMIPAMLFQGDCNGKKPNAADQQQAAQTSAIARESNAQVGMPGITRFTEKRLMRQLYEKRDQEKLLTYSYTQDLQGRLWHVCDSIGYGLPYGTQFSNPQYVAVDEYQHGVLALPQPEPNGLFMPPEAEGTWLQCIGPGGKVEPMYVEPRVIVSAWKLKTAGSYAPE